MSLGEMSFISFGIAKMIWPSALDRPMLGN
jgi:hypothetical protein